MLGASAQASELPVKIARPVMKMRRRPTKSASLPPISMNAAKVNAYPATTHSSSESDMCSDRRIDGSATLTTVLWQLDHEQPHRHGGERPPFYFCSGVTKRCIFGSPRC